MRVLGNSRRNWQPARACWQGPNDHAPNRGRNRVDHRTITERMGGTSVHSKPVLFVGCRQRLNDFRASIIVGTCISVRLSAHETQ